jgi:hypothetical protein
MQQVLGDHRLADTVGTDEDDVGGLLQELQGQQFLEEIPVDLFRPGEILSLITSCLADNSIIINGLR